MKRYKTRSIRSSNVAALRTGTILVIVLVVVALLALGAYTFAEIMVVEAQATATYGREVQARVLADSGVDLASTVLMNRYLPNSKSYYNDPQTFEAVLLKDATTARGRGRFSVVTGNELDTSGRSVRFGLSDESAKLNLNTFAKMLAAGTLKAADAKLILMAFPEMTEEIAECILDWFDSDSTQMQSGAESDYYQGLSPPYSAKNGPIDSLDELLLVKGVTAQLLFGEDTNHNGILDPNENDGATSLPLDNADGMLQRGWSAFWTVYSREINLRSDGTPRTNVNQSDLTALYNAISADFDVKTATFVLAYRLNGPASTGNNSAIQGGQSGQSGQGGNSSSGGGNSVSSSSSGGSNTGKSSSNSGSSKSSGSSGSGSQQSTQSSTGSKQSSSSSKSGSSTSGGAGQGAGSATPTLVGGIDINPGAKYTIASLFELLGARTQATVNGVSTQLTSPWGQAPGELSQALPLITDKLSLTDAAYLDGRININMAPQEVLMGLAGLQGMTPTIIEAIYGAQANRMGVASGFEVAPERLNTGWLLIDGIVTSLDTLKTLDPFITGRGDVFHLQSVGYFEGGGPMARIEAVIDATQDPPQVIFLRDLTEMGRGFSASLVSQ